MTAIEERRNLYRDLILAASEREFARVGFAETKVTVIAKAAGLSLATVYKSFPSKDDIWNDLHTERMNALIALVDERVAGIRSPLERLLAGIAAVGEFLAGHDAYLELNLGASASWLTDSGTTGVQHTVWSSGLDMIAGGVEAACAAGEIRDLRPRIAAGLVVSALQVWLADWVDEDRDRDAPELIRDLVAHLRIILTATPG